MCKKGFTFLDLIIAVMILGIISLVVLGRIEPDIRKKIEVIAGKLKADIETARTLSLSTGRNYSCILIPPESGKANNLYPGQDANNYYFIFGSGEIYTDPVSSQKMYSNLNTHDSLPYAQLLISQTREIIFSRLGYITTESSTEVRLAKSGYTFEISVNRTSGIVRVDQIN